MIATILLLHLLPIITSPNCLLGIRREPSVPKDAPDVNIAAHTFTFRELSIATENFRPECHIGEGGFEHVYKGHLENSQVGSLELVSDTHSPPSLLSSLVLSLVLPSLEISCSLMKKLEAKLDFLFPFYFVGLFLNLLLVVSGLEFLSSFEMDIGMGDLIATYSSISAKDWRRLAKI